MFSRKKNAIVVIPEHISSSFKLICFLWSRCNKSYCYL